MRRSRPAAAIALIGGLTLSFSAWAAPGGNGKGNGGGNTGGTPEGPVDVYLYHDALYGIQGDAFVVSGDPSYPQWGAAPGATVYPANSSDPVSCVRAIGTVRETDGYVRMFVPPPGADCPDGRNRLVHIASPYDLDQDGLCVTPYTGRQVSGGGFDHYYSCVAAEPDGREDVMITLYLDDVLGSSMSTPVSVKVRLMEYGENYTPQAGVDPGWEDISYIGSQDRAYVIDLQTPAIVTQDSGDPDVRHFVNMEGSADICQVFWKNAHSHDCQPISGGLVGLYIGGAVDSTAAP